MSTTECKKDAERRLSAAGVKFSKLTAKTTDFGGLGYGKSVFVGIHGLVRPMPKEVFGDVPKPSAGGYCVEILSVAEAS